jgi:hypothetical protein
MWQVLQCREPVDVAVITTRPRVVSSDAMNASAADQTIDRLGPDRVGHPPAGNFIAVL